MLLTEKHRSKICQIYSIVYELCNNYASIIEIGDRVMSRLP